MRLPWPRTLHAELIRRLSELGAAVIAFDVPFSEHTTPEEDAEIAAAIAEAGNVVLAAEVVARETAETIEEIGVFPIIEFTEAGARPGRTGMVLDGDAIARRVRMHPEAFWRVVVGLLAEIFPDDVQVPYVPPGALLRYLGPPETFPYISYYQVLQGDPSIPEDLFAGAMVLVGLRPAFDPVYKGVQVRWTGFV